jgi:aspartate aminotransferase
LSGTGSLHLAGLLLAQCQSPRPKIVVPEPTWSNHHQVFSAVGFDCISFGYYDKESKTVDMVSYLNKLRSVEPKSIILLHACAHNPTGCDPSEQEWRQIGQIMKERDLFPIFDAAYLGFNSGSFHKDAFAIRHFVNDLNLEAVICVSFAKNMGLYGTVICSPITLLL